MHKLAAFIFAASCLVGCDAAAPEDGHPVGLWRTVYSIRGAETFQDEREPPSLLHIAGTEWTQYYPPSDSPHCYSFVSYPVVSIRGSLWELELGYTESRIVLQELEVGGDTLRVHARIPGDEEVTVVYARERRTVASIAPLCE